MTNIIRAVALMIQEKIKGKQSPFLLMLIATYFIGELASCYGKSPILEEYPANNLYCRAIKNDCKELNSVTKSCFLSFQTDNSYANLIRAKGNCVSDCGVSLQKKAETYGLEFLGAEIGAITATCYIGLGWAVQGEIESRNAIYAYVLMNSALTPTCCWFTGKLLRQEGSLCNTILGTGIGIIIGSIYVNKWIERSGSDGFNICMLTISPAIGAVIGYNL
jgi:hypothetical protein